MSQPTSITNQDKPPTTLGPAIADLSAKHLAKSWTRDRTASRFNPVGLTTITETLDLHQHTDTRLHPPNMSKRPAKTPLVLKTAPKKPEATNKPEIAKETADMEYAPINANDRPSASKTPESTEEEATSPIDGDEDTLVSEEVTSTPQKRNSKASTPKKTGANASSPKEKDTKAETPKMKGTRASAPKKGSNAVIPKTKGNKPPVGDGFWPYKHSITKPPSDPFWGVRPVPGDPWPHPDQPSARASNGQTNPPLFENRGYRYKRGARYVRHHYTIDPLNIEHLPRNRDQEDLLAVPLIDMRPKKVGKDLVPKRIPDVYCYERVPKDWNCKQSIKALNDRRYQAIDRETMDGPWTHIEQDYLARLIRENPDASIWELTELHNDRFMGKDFKENVGFAMGYLSTGRTVESVRYQYTTYKPFYDRGRVPVVRWRGDKSAEGVEFAKWFVKVHGPPSKAEQLAHDKAHGGDESDDDDDTTKKGSSQKKTSKTVENEDGEDAFDTPLSGKRRASEEPEDDQRPVKYSKTGDSDPFAGQDRLEDDDEELLALAVDYEDDDYDAVETEEMTEGQYIDAETQADSDLHATRRIVIDEDYDDEP